MTEFPKPPAHIEPYVRILGAEDTITVLMALGGGEIYLTANPKGRSALVELVGPERAIALAESIGHLKVRVPTAKPWIARCWRAKGLPVAEIARRLHTADKTVRGWLAGGNGPGGTSSVRDPRQLRLF